VSTATTTDGVDIFYKDWGARRLSTFAAVSGRKSSDPMDAETGQLHQPRLLAPAISVRARRRPDAKRTWRYPPALLPYRLG
jgi:hypothetical protein